MRREELGTICTALCTLHIELYVCMYFIACYYELLNAYLYEL